MTGDEALARGAYEAGALVGAAYPGTPSTEIMENFSAYDGVYAEWSVNEKVACGGRVYKRSPQFRRHEARRP